VTKRYYPVYWAPDLDPSWEINPGVLQRVDMCIPTKLGGLRPVNAYDLGNDVGGHKRSLRRDLRHPIIGSATANGTFVGTDSRLVVVSLGPIAGPTRARAGGAYTTTADWQFATRGSRTFAASITNAAAGIDLGRDVCDCAGSPPKASFVVAQSNFLLLADTDDGTRTTDQIWTSAVGNDADFAPSLSTECGTYLLRDTRRADHRL
jgi:hypothetical protein